MSVDRLAALMDRYTGALVLFARSWCDSPEDAVQDAFCKLASSRIWPADPAAWLFQVTRRRAQDLGRAQRRRLRREAQAARPERWFHEESRDGLDAADAVAALQTLPVELREIIILRLWGEQTLEQAAATAGCSVSTAHRRYETGLASLRRQLGPIREAPT